MKIIDINGKHRECDSVIPDRKFPGNMKINYTSKVRKGYKHSEWYPIDTFIKNNPDLISLTRLAPTVIKEDLGMVSSAGKDFLVDKTKNWKEDIYKNSPIWISRGKGAGQKRMVIKNTKNKIFIDQVWKEVPNGTSQYVLSVNINYSLD